jgi:hypothetical protein
MDIIYPNLFLALPERVRRERKERRRAYEFAAGQHRGTLTTPTKSQPDKLPRLLRGLHWRVLIPCSEDHCDRKIE